MVSPSAARAALTLSLGVASVSVSFVPFTVRPDASPATPIVSAASTRTSSVGVSVKVPVPLVAPLAMVTSKSDTVA